MTEAALLKQIEAAKLVILDAENHLKNVARAPVTRGEDLEISEEVPAASSRLSVAEEQLRVLEKLLALVQIDAASTKVEVARNAVSEAERGLEKALNDVVPSTGQETWVTEVVESAFTALSTAKRMLNELEAAIAADKD